jgi:hypothetical protein
VIVRPLPYVVLGVVANARVIVFAPLTHGPSYINVAARGVAAVAVRNPALTPHQMPSNEAR